MTDITHATRATGTTHLLRTEEALRLVKRSERIKGASFGVTVTLPACIEGDPEHHFPEGLRGSVTISRADATRLLSRLLSPGLEARGGRIRIVEYAYKSAVLGDSVMYLIY